MLTFVMLKGQSRVTAEIATLKCSDADERAIEEMVGAVGRKVLPRKRDKYRDKTEFGLLRFLNF